MVFQNGCGQMDLASACVLHPLNHLVLDFEVGVDGQMNEQRSGGYTGPEMVARIDSGERS